jgi:YegS/Rv2252/BmrU family lipid kinase
MAEMDKNGNILLVVNPISGNTDKNAIVDLLKSKLSGIPMETYETTGEKDKEKLRKLIKRHRPERVLVAGGDGTIKLVAEALKKHQATIGILPAGSANGLARDLELPTVPEKYIPIALGENTREIDAIFINGQLCLHISDFGLNAELIKKYEESNFRGKFGYFVNSISALYDTEMPYLFKIKANGTERVSHGIMLAFANSRKYGTGAVVNPKGKIDDGKFEILIFKKFDIFEILNTLQNEVEIPTDFVETIATEKATVTTDHPVDFQIDGEYRKAIKKVKAKILPRKLKVAVK